MINGNKYAISKDGIDVTEDYKKGAREVLEIAKKLNIKKAILQPRSPSCGVNKVYNGNFDKTLVDGNGLTAELLKENGIEVLSSDEI